MDEDVRAGFIAGLAEREDFIDIDQAAALARVSPAQLRRWAALKRPRVIAVQHPERGLMFPRWQFEPSLWPVVQRLAAALQGDAFAVLLWLEMPHGAFGGRTPRAALEQGEPPERVHAAAAAEGL